MTPRGVVWGHRKGIKMEEKCLKGRNEGNPSGPILNSLWEGMRDAGERSSGIKAQEPIPIEFPFPGVSCARFPGQSHVFLSHGSRFFQAPSQLNLSGTARWDFPLFPLHSQGKVGNDTNPIPAGKIPTAGKGPFMASCSLWSNLGMGLGSRHPPSSCQLGKGFSIPAHSQCPREADELPGKKKKKKSWIWS